MLNDIIRQNSTNFKSIIQNNYKKVPYKMYHTFYMELFLWTLVC